MLIIFLTTKICRDFSSSYQNALISLLLKKHHLPIAEFNSILTLSIWRYLPTCYSLVVNFPHKLKCLNTWLCFSNVPHRRKSVTGEASREVFFFIIPPISCSLPLSPSRSLSTPCPH